MKIAAITQFKNGVLFNAMSHLGLTQANLAARSGVSTAGISSILNLKRRPQKGTAEKIEAALSELGVVIDILGDWPQEFMGTGKKIQHAQIADVQFESIEDHPEVLAIAEESEEDRELVECKISAMKEQLDTLKPREKEVLLARFIQSRTYGEMAKGMGITSARVRQIEHKALRKMRQPVRIVKIIEA